MSFLCLCSSSQSNTALSTAVFPAHAILFFWVYIIRAHFVFVPIPSHDLSDVDLFLQWPCRLMATAELVIFPTIVQLYMLG